MNLIEKEWETYRDRVILPSIVRTTSEMDPLSRAEAVLELSKHVRLYRRAFFAGAQATASLLLESEPGVELSLTRVVNVAATMHEECGQFIQDLEAGKA